MIIKSLLQRISVITVISLILALVPVSTAKASWNGQFTLSSATYTVGEAGRYVTITIHLSGSKSGKPNTSVHYATSDGTAKAGLDYTTISGNKSFNKKGSRTFTIPITSDFIVEGNETFTVTLSSPTNGATLGTPSTAVVTIVDDDTAGISVAPTSGLNVTEAGGTAAFSVVLMKQPSANVTIGLSSSVTTEGTVSPASLTFTSSNWNTAEPVTITGVDDFVDDGDIPFTIITTAATSTDPVYSGMPVSDIAVTNIDNDTAGITVTPTSGLSVTEIGGTVTFSVELTSQPVADVSLDLSSSDITEGTVVPVSLTFKSDNWNTPQNVTVTGVDDGNFVDGNINFSIITAAASSTDPKYNGLNASDVLVTNIDNDTAGITVIAASGLSVTEPGGMATFSVVLNNQPGADVNLGLSSSDTTEGTVSPESLTFTMADWNNARTVTITGSDDFVDDGDQVFMIVTAAATSSDSHYNGIDANDVSVTNIDNDTAGITVDPTGGLFVTEAGGTATFTVVLTSQPGDDVTIALSSSNTAEGMVSPDSLTFTIDNWNIPLLVTITGVDDTDPDGDIDFVIITAAANSMDPAYGGMDASDVQVTNIDDDDAPPVAIPDTYSTLFKSPLDVSSPGVLSNDYDPDADPLMAELYGLYPEHGILTFYDDGSFAFIPNDSFSGEVTFQYKAFDGIVYSPPVTVVIEIVAKHQFLPAIKR